MKRIETIGGPGIGKTTLFKEIIKLKKAKDCWVTVEEARRNLAKTVKPKNKLHKLFQFYLKINLISIYQQQMAIRILNSYTSDVLDSMWKSYSDVADLIFKGLNKNNNNAVIKMVLASYCYKLLIKEIMLFDYFKVDDFVVFDESIIHNSSAFSDAKKIELIFKNHEKLKTGVIPKRLIYCFLEEERYLERRKNRIREGKGTLVERTLKQQELKIFCYRSLKYAEEKIKVLKNYNIEILELNMEEPVSDNAKQAYDFINNLSKKL